MRRITGNETEVSDPNPTREINIYKTPSLFEECLLAQTPDKRPVNQFGKRILQQIKGCLQNRHVNTLTLRIHSFTKEKPCK
jgi:hypothetical protein